MKVAPERHQTALPRDQLESKRPPFMDGLIKRALSHTTSFISIQYRAKFHARCLLQNQPVFGLVDDSPETNGQVDRWLNRSTYLSTDPSIQPSIRLSFIYQSIGPVHGKDGWRTLNWAKLAKRVSASTWPKSSSTLSAR